MRFKPDFRPADPTEIVWLDVLALVVLSVFAFLGARKGGLATGVGLLALVAGYATAVAAGAFLGSTVAAGIDTSELVVIPLLGTLGFLIAFVSVSWFGGRMARRDREQLGDATRSPRDRFLGALFGSVRGALVVVLLSWLALWVDALRVTGGTAVIPPIESSTAAAVTGSLVEAGVETALSDAGSAGRFAARIASRPAAALSDLEDLFDGSELGALRDDAMFWSYVENGAIDTALTRRSFLTIARDETMRERLAGLGLVTAAAGDDAVVFRDEVASVLHEVGPRIRRLRDDPELQALVEDPEVAALLQSGDTFALASHPGIRRLAARAAAGPTGP